MTHNGSVHNGQTPAETLTQIVAADGTSGGFVKDSQASAAGLTLLALSSLSSVLSGYLYGLTLANNGADATNDIDVAAGSCIDSANATLMAVSALTKRLDAGWAAGTNQGMRNSAIAIADTTYHIYAVSKAGGADPDVYAHTSATVSTVITALQAETGGSLYTLARRIGSIIRESAAIVAFVQAGDIFYRSIPAAESSVNNPGTSAVLSTLKVPSGIAVEAMLALTIYDATPAAGTNILVTSPSQADTAATSIWNAFVPPATAVIPASDTFRGRILTNTSAQVRYRLSASNTDITVYPMTHGWVDPRGRLA